MKKHWIALLLSIFATQVNAQDLNAPYCLIDSTYFYDLDSNIVGRDIYQFNQQGKTTKKLTYDKVGQSWVLVKKADYTYLTDGKLDQILTRKTTDNGTTYTNDTHEKLTYDNAHISERLVKQWENNTWKNSTRTINEYDATGNQTFYAYYNSYFEMYNIWIGKDRKYWTYDSTGLLLSHWLDRWLPEALTFTPSRGQEYTYDANNRVTQLKHKGIINLYNQIGDYWTEDYVYNTLGQLFTETITYHTLIFPDNDQFITYTYNQAGLPIQKYIIEKIKDEEDLEVFTYVTAGRVEYSYDAHNLLAEEFELAFDVDSTWNPKSKITYTYDQDGNETEKIEHLYLNEEWKIASETSREWFNENDIHWQNIHTYLPYSATNPLKKTEYKRFNEDNYFVESKVVQYTNQETEYEWFEYFYGHCDEWDFPEEIIESEFNLYPNPVLDQLTVLLSVPGTISIYNEMGTLIMQFQGTTGSNTLYLSQLQTGIYLLRLEDNSFKRFLKL